MPKTKYQELIKLGQSIWLDYIDRPLLETGKLKKMIEEGLRGMTSNPTIFCQAISTSSDYDERIAKLKETGKSTFEIYDELTIKDIQDACDLFKGVYESTKRLDGYVSLEINPQLANDTESSIKEGKRLFKKVNRPNVMIKIPSTDAGFPVIEELLASGINVNVTLIFSLEQYVHTVEAFFKGIKRLAQKENDLSKICSVASVFVSRIDTSADKLLDEKMAKEPNATVKAKLKMLKGKAAVANSQMIFAKSKELFSTKEFKMLFQKGLDLQRVLWGSTGTKNPEYSDVKYVEELIGISTVNTLPEKTIQFFLDHGVVKETLTGDTKEAQKIIKELKSFGLDIDEVCKKLLFEGVASFDKSFSDLIKSIETKAQQLCAH